MPKITVQADWDSCPHLTEGMKKDLLRSMRPHQRNARMKGIPTLGAGAIYPISEMDFMVDPFPIPPHWRKSYALDVGWKRTAAIFGAIDESDNAYLYAEHYVSEQKPPIHADAIKAKGAWMHGVVDPASRGRSQTDGERLFSRYTELGLKLSYADNSLDAGLDKVWEMLVSGRLKVFSTLANWFYEFRLYRRDDKGKIVKKDDHLMDATRYWCMSGMDVAMPSPGAFGNRAGKAPKHSYEWDVLKQIASETNIR